VIPFSVSDVPLRPIYHMASQMLEGIPVFEIRDDFGMTDMMVTSPERGRSLVESLADSVSVLMRGHGIAVTGPTIPHAVGRSIYTQINADLQLKAISLGGTVNYLDPREAQAQLDRGEHRGYSRSWELWKRDSLAAMPQQTPQLPLNCTDKADCYGQRMSAKNFFTFTWRHWRSNIRSVLRAYLLCAGFG